MSTSGRNTSRRRSSTTSRGAPGLRVRYDLYDSNEPVLEKLQSGVADYDIVVPSDYMVRILVQLKLVRPLAKARLKNLGNLDPRFLDKNFDPHNRTRCPTSGARPASATTGGKPAARSTAGPLSSTPPTKGGSSCSTTCASVSP